jgi:predicted MPP superfamily phosphohydrolase
MVWLAVMTIAMVLFIRAYRNTFHATINRVPIEVKPSDRFHIDEFAPIRILHLSDLHMENLSIDAERIVTDFRHEPIDLIAITGDLLDRHKNIPRAIAYVQTIMRLKPALGTFVVFGNHDYVLPPDKLALLKHGLEQIGAIVLRNNAVTLDADGRKLHVIGVDDYSTRRSNLEKAFRTVTPDGLRIVLTHDPNVVLKMKEYDFDYLLAGHFHGGQIHWPKPYHLLKMGKLPRMNMVKGLHYHDGRPFYISEGLGQTGLNVRLRSRPEITLHTLRPQRSPAVRHPAEMPDLIAQEAAPTLALE